MLKLKRNENKMGMRPKGKTWEWYTAKVSIVFNIHVHNNTKTMLWCYEINTTPQVFFNGFSTKEDAFEAAKENAKNLLTQALRGIE